MTFELFEQYSKEFNLLPVYRIIKSDLYTPISIFLKLRKHYNKMFLLESAEVDEKFGRYSFIGIEPTNIIKLTDGKLFYNNEIVENDLFNFLNSLLKNISYPKLDELSYFKGGFVGFIGTQYVACCYGISLFFQPFSDDARFHWLTLTGHDHCCCHFIFFKLVNTTDRMAWSEKML